MGDLGKLLLKKEDIRWYYATIYAVSNWKFWSFADSPNLKCFRFSWISCKDVINIDKQAGLESKKFDLCIIRQRIVENRVK